MDLLTDVLAVVGSLLYVVTAVPALITVIRNRQAEAISPVTLDLLLLSGSWWVVYSYDIGNIPSLVSSALALLSPLTMLILKLRARTFPMTSVAIVVLGIVALVVVDERSVRNLGLLAAAFSLFIVMPTAWSVLYRKRPAPHASPGFWLLQAVTAAVWLTYGILIGHPILGLTGVVVAPLSVLILLRVRQDARGLAIVNAGS